MTLHQIRYIPTIAEIGSINRAAEQLYVAQPSLTNAIKEVEKELGITIFNRSGRGVTLTPDGSEFVMYARQVYAQYQELLDKYGKAEHIKKKFGVTTQHYSFAVKAFVEMVKAYDITLYEFAIREGRTAEVISDVATQRSEIGILYLSDFNRQALRKTLAANSLEFSPLIDCQAYVYLWKGHPLAGEKEISFDQLMPYPCISFEQGENSSYYFAEEILTTFEYPRTIKSCDRATNLNLMVGLNGYTLCSGIICEELNGTDYVAVPFKADEEHPNQVMTIGVVTRKNTVRSSMARLYLSELRRYLGLPDQAGA